MKQARAKLKQTAVFAPLFVAAKAALDWIDGELLTFTWYATGLVLVAVMHFALMALFGD